MEVNSCYFVGTDYMGYEPICGTLSVANGTVMSIGHLFAASVFNGGAAPFFPSHWLYTYISSGLQSVPTCLHSTLPPGSCYCETYGEVINDKAKYVRTNTFNKIRCSW